MTLADQHLVLPVIVQPTPPLTVIKTGVASVNVQSPTLEAVTIDFLDNAISKFNATQGNSNCMVKLKLRIAAVISLLKITK